MKLSAVSEDGLSALTRDQKTRIVFDAPRDAGGPAAAALLLGCSPPEMRWRALEAARLWREGLVPLVIPTGGVTHETEIGRMTEAEYMARILNEEGLPDGAVFLENEANTTRGNMIYGSVALELALHQRKRYSVYIVTSASHMRRSLLIAGIYLPRTVETLARAAVPPGASRDDWHESADVAAKVDTEIRLLRGMIENREIPDIEF